MIHWKAKAGGGAGRSGGYPFYIGAYIKTGFKAAEGKYLEVQFTDSDVELLVEALALYHPGLIKAAGRVLDKHGYRYRPSRSHDHVMVRELREAVRAVKEETHE